MIEAEVQKKLTIERWFCVSIEWGEGYFSRQTSRKCYQWW